MIRQPDGRWLVRAGGAPWNVARVMAGLGIASAFAGGVGRDGFGDGIAALASSAGLDMRFLQRHDTPTLMAFVHEAAPPRYHFIGFDSADLAFDPAMLPPGWTRAADWLHCGGISLARAPLRDRIAGMLEQARAAGVRVSLDPNFREALPLACDATFARIAALADVIKVSDADLHGLFRTGDASQGLSRLRALNPQAAVLLTLGERGAQLHAGNRCWHEAAPRVAVADTVGAGDASVGGLLASLMTAPDAGWGPHLRRAVAAGTAACMQPGAFAPGVAQIDAVQALMA